MKKHLLGKKPHIPYNEKNSDWSKKTTSRDVGTTKKKDVQELPNTRKMKKKYGTFCQSVYTLLILKIT